MGLTSSVKKPKEIEQFSGWAHLPSVVLTKIFIKLDAKDRRNASLACRTWRETYFHPRFWPFIKFSFTPGKLDEARWFTSLFGRNLKNAKVTLDTSCQLCLRAFIQLLQHLEENNNLKSLFIYPDPRTFKMPAKMSHQLRVKLVDELLASLHKCLPRLDEFGMGCGPNLPNCSLDQLLMSLNTAVLKISLCSYEKDCSELHFNPVLLRRFSKLQILRINLSQVSENLITVLLDLEALQKIILHMDNWINGNVSEIFENFKLLKRKKGKRVYIVYKFWWWLDKQNTDVLLLHYRQMSSLFCQIAIPFKNFYFDIFHLELLIFYYELKFHFFNTF
ncbi:uncharacterized protein [Leptinotarsa decemlineata]|uniref:uncharacterized protein n=1 Tax=Leptinotarsa decemlineata TaxID=7539 RepID=UPI003D3052AC